MHTYTYIAVPSVTVTSVSHPLLTINCTTSGAPALVTWDYISGGLILRDDENHRIIHSLRDGSTATYDSTIAFTFIPLNETGVHACRADTTYISSNTSETNISTVTGIDRKFVMLYVMQLYDQMWDNVVVFSFKTQINTIRILNTCLRSDHKNRA